MFIVAITIFMGLIVTGIIFWKKNRKLSLLSFIPLLLLVVFGGYFIYQNWQSTTPDSLHFTIQKKNEAYVVQGDWEERLDTYSTPSDFLVFYVPNNTEITNIKRNQLNDERDWRYMVEELRDWIKKETQPKGAAQIFDIRKDKQFQFSFELPENINPNEVSVYYVHAISEPMEPLKFWKKHIELK